MKSQFHGRNKCLCINSVGIVIVAGLFVTSTVEATSVLSDTKLFQWYIVNEEDENGDLRRYYESETLENKQTREQGTTVALEIEGLEVGRAQTSVGTNRASANLSSTSGLPMANCPESCYQKDYRAESYSSWDDNFTITGGASGTLGTVSFHVGLDGHINAPGTPDIPDTFDLEHPAYYYFSLTSAGSSFHQSSVWEANRGAGQSIDDQLLAVFKFEYGVEYSLSGSLRAFAYPGDTVDFFNTGTIDLVQIPIGAQINFESGTLFNVAAVPIPAAVWLMCSGVFGLVALQRRWRGDGPLRKTINI